MVYLLAVYFLFFSLLAWKNFRWAVFLFILLLPSYLMRFEVFQLGKITFPTTTLELSFGALFLVWLIKYVRQDWLKIKIFVTKYKIFCISAAIFFLSSVISIFVSDMPIPSFGEWRAFFLEPMIFFFILVGRKELFRANDLLLALGFSTLSISMYALFQEFTGIGIATPEWTAVATRRVTAFFSSPNAVGLYLAPVLMLMIIIFVSRVKQPQGAIIRRWELLRHPATAGLLAMILLTVLTIVFTKSQGTWIGVGAGMLVFIFFVGYKKIAIAMAIAGIVFSLVVPSMRQAVLFQDQANKNRLRLWGYSWTFLEQSPKNFVLGTGVRQFFRKVQKPYYDKYVMERLIYPHNIFLNFWTEIGLPGMLAVIVMLTNIFYLANKIRQNDKVMGAGLMATITVLVVHGLVDVPYFKNDLAFLFWILIIIPFLVYENIYQGQTERV
jgi:O-antigen ligase